MRQFERKSVLRECSLGIAMGFHSRQEQEIFLSPTGSGPALGHIQPPIKWVSGILSQGVMRLGREADHSPPSSAEVKNCGATPLLPILHGMVLN
jgi:hypothetical protein